MWEIGGDGDRQEEMSVPDKGREAPALPDSHAEPFSKQVSQCGRGGQEGISDPPPSERRPPHLRSERGTIAMPSFL